MRLRTIELRKIKRLRNYIKNKGLLDTENDRINLSESIVYLVDVSVGKRAYTDAPIRAKKAPQDPSTSVHSGCLWESHWPDAWHSNSSLCLLTEPIRSAC